MQIEIIHGKPTLTRNKFTLGTFTSQAQAEQAASEIEPILKEKDISIIPILIIVIKRNGGKP